MYLLHEAKGVMMKEPNLLQVQGPITGASLFLSVLFIICAFVCKTLHHQIQREVQELFLGVHYLWLIISFHSPAHSPIRHMNYNTGSIFVLFRLALYYAALASSHLNECSDSSHLP